MATTGWVLPTARTVDAGSGTWTNDANILADDGTEATFSLATKNATGRWLRGQTFGFDSLIPSGATVDAVEIRTDWRVNSTGGIANQELQAFVSGTGVGAVRARTTEPTTLTVDTFDITADRSWVRADLLNGTFELRTRGRNGNNATDPSYRWDYIAAQVTYTVPPIDLTVADAAHGHTADAVALTQVHELAVADSVHASSADTVVLSQVHSLVVADSAHTHATEGVTLSSSTDLVVADSEHSHSVDALTLTQDHVLTVADSSHAHGAESPGLTQAHNLTVEDSLHGHTADAVALTQVHNLSPSDTAHAHQAESVGLTQTHVLTVADSAHSHVSDEVTLSSAVELAPADTAHSHTADELTISQVHVLEVAASIVNHAAESLTLTQIHILTAEDTVNGSSADQVMFGASGDEPVLASADRRDCRTTTTVDNRSRSTVNTRTSHAV